MKDKGRNKRGVPPSQVEGFSPDPSLSLDFFITKREAGVGKIKAEKKD